jgi:hypothetical protein
LLGLLFLVFGLNGFLHFLPMGPMPSGSAGKFIGALAESHFMTVVFALQLIPAVMLLLNQYVPLALTLLGPVIVNIVLFHALMDPAGLPPGAIAAVLWFLAAHDYRANFSGLLHRRVEA